MMKKAFFTLAVSVLPLGAAFGKNLKESFNHLSGALKSAAEEYGDDFEVVEKSFDGAHLKGIVSEKAADGPITLKEMKLNGHRRATATRPGGEIKGEVKWSIDTAKGSPFSSYKVIIGIHRVGGQTAFSVAEKGKKGREKFVLTAPKEKGVYQVRFQVADGYFDASPESLWNEPGEAATLGLIVVK